MKWVRIVVEVVGWAALGVAWAGIIVWLVTKN
jgi:hypothetical protein